MPPETAADSSSELFRAHPQQPTSERLPNLFGFAQVKPFWQNYFSYMSLKLRLSQI
jgi:hypothetical protein